MFRKLAKYSKFSKELQIFILSGIEAFEYKSVFCFASRLWWFADQSALIQSHKLKPDGLVYQNTIVYRLHA